LFEGLKKTCRILSPSQGMCVRAATIRAIVIKIRREVSDVDLFAARDPRDTLPEHEGRQAMRILILTVMLLTSASVASAGATDEVMQADRDFAKRAQETSVGEAFAHYSTPDVHWFVPGPAPIVGPAAVKARLDKAFSGGAKLEWEPKRAWASPDGRMAITYGRSKYTSAKNAKGETFSSTGSYMTVWMKQADGTWKMSHDMGTDDPESKP
jgi:ketosteroid isomerase-like protein